MAVFMKGGRGGNKVMYSGFLYKKKYTKNIKDYYQCDHDGCTVSLHMRINSLNVIHYNGNGQHHHANPDNKIALSDLMDESKRRIDADPTKHLPKLWEEVVDWHDQLYDVGLVYPDFAEVKSTLYRHRSLTLPALPVTVDDIDFAALNQEWSRTHRGSLFMRKHDTQFGITIFTTLEQLQLLADSRHNLADGTFKTAPPPYAQLYTVHGLEDNRRIPLVFALMLNKSTADYRRLFQLLHRYTQRATNRVWSPRLLVTDYETGVINAVATELPNTDHGGCLFHFDQAIFKKVKEYGLTRAYRRDQRVQDFVRKIMALPFLPIPLLRMNYNLHKGAHNHLYRRYPALVRLTTYFEMTWLNGPFPVAMWNVYNRHPRLRTTNTVEGWHHRWNILVGRTRPNFWYLVIALKREEAHIHRAIRKIRGNRPPPPQIRRYRVLNEMIVLYKREYQQNIKTLDQYWEAVKYVCHNF
jgi:hypothetical protein